MTYATLIFETLDDVALIRLNDPATLNAMTPRMTEEMREAITAAERSARALVLSSVGRAFSSGVNLSREHSAEITRVDAGLMLETHVNPLMSALRGLSIPWVSAVRGPAAGVGASIALAADLIVAGESAYFLQAFRRIGLVPDGGSAYLLARAIGRVRAMELMLLGGKLAAKTALEWGLINRVVPDTDVETTTLELARELAQGPTRCLGLIRKLSWEALDSTWEDQLKLERELQREAGTTKDFKEGVTAFQQKRPAKFSGR
jgi:2-(1,2-epoxy-1,2-dihydrophenyl)acetyl-CoA isomerase